MKVSWTEQAFERLAEIQDFIARDAPSAAARLVDKIIERAENLASFPVRGRVVPEIGNLHVREVFEGNYRIVYRTTKQTVEVLTVFEGHKLLREEELVDPKPTD